jgi:hypothetical protein
MIRNFLTLMMCFVCFAFSSLASAQEAAPEATAEATPPAVSDTTVNAEPGSTVIVNPPDAEAPGDNTKLLVAIGIGGAALIAVFIAAWAHVPAWAQQMLLQNRVTLEQAVNTGTGALVTLSRTTPNTLDDTAADVVRELARKEVKRLLDEWVASGTLPPPQSPTG